MGGTIGIRPQVLAGLSVHHVNVYPLGAGHTDKVAVVKANQSRGDSQPSFKGRVSYLCGPSICCR